MAALASMLGTPMTGMTPSALVSPAAVAMPPLEGKPVDGRAKAAAAVPGARPGSVPSKNGHKEIIVVPTTPEVSNTRPCKMMLVLLLLFSELLL